MIVRYQLHNKKWMEVFRAYQAPRREKAALVPRVSVTSRSLAVGHVGLALRA